jgi:hypothetical protein
MFRLQQPWLRLSLAGVLCFACLYALKAADETPALTKEQIKQFLLTAKIVGDRPEKKGVTNTRRLTLSDGTTTHDASFQPINEHAMVKKFASGTTEINFVDSYKYNIAAYNLAELVGFDDMMPVYVERKWKGDIGSLSWYLPKTMDEAERVQKKIEPPDTDAWNKQMFKIRVFDELVYDNDPNLTNVLIGADWKIWRIDYSRAFRTFHALKDPKDLVRCDRQMLELLKALKESDVAEKTKPYLTKDEIKAVMARRDIIVDFFQKQIAQKGEAEVLF